MPTFRHCHEAKDELVYTPCVPSANRPRSTEIPLCELK
jgi:hypothetical protein